MKTTSCELFEEKKIILFGVDKSTIPMIKYADATGIKIACIAVQHMMIAPHRCALIPSLHSSYLNSFSETEMVMDKEIMGKLVQRLDQIPENEYETVMYVYEEQPFHEISVLGNSIGFTNIRVLTKFMLREICKIVFEPYDLYSQSWINHNELLSEFLLLKHGMKRMLKPTVYDFHFEFHLVEHCNLRCKGCTHFAPLAKEEFLDVDEFQRDIMRLSELTGKRSRFINLLGGEPLLHPQVDVFARMTREAFPETTIRIVTNGILLSEMPDAFWNACREYSIEIGVTEYPIDVDYEKCRRIVEKNGVVYISFSGDGVRDEMWKLAIDESGSNRPMHNFMRCPRPNACVFCAHGKIYTCATMANIHHFNRFFNKSLLLEDTDFIDIYKVKDISEVLEYLRNPASFCRYCNIERRKYGVLWQPSEFKIEEWT